MGSKKKKYNARFPPARIKKIMQTDEEVGKIAAAVPVVISRALELFLESLITESVSKANERSAKTLTSSHIKGAIHSNPAFDFLKTQVAAVPELEADTDPNKLERGDNSPALSHRTLSHTNSSSSTTDNCQSPTTERKRHHNNTNNSETAAISTATTPTDSKLLLEKPKRKRGRPPKNKALHEEPQKTVEKPPDSIPPSLPANGPTDLSMPHVTPTASQATDTVQTPQPSSIFSTESTVLSQVNYKSPAAHTGNQSLRLNVNTLPPYYPGSLSTSNSVLSMYANLSPTSQPIDLSTKSCNINANDTGAYLATTMATKHTVTGNGTTPDPGGIPLIHEPTYKVKSNDNDDDDDDYDT